MARRAATRIAGLTLIAAGLLHGCAGEGTSSKPKTPADLAVRYACNDASRLVARFVYAEPRHVVIERYGLPALELPQVAAASGFRYSDGQSALAGAGEVAEWRLQGGPPVRCLTKHPPAEYAPGSALYRPAG